MFVRLLLILCISIISRQACLLVEFRAWGGLQKDRSYLFGMLVYLVIVYWTKLQYRESAKKTGNKNDKLQVYSGEQEI